MDDFFKAVFELLQVAEKMQTWFGLSKEASETAEPAIILLLVLLVTSLLKLVWWLIKEGVTHYKNSKTARDLAPYFTYLNVKEARKYFIKTRFQNNSPTREEEPAFTHRYVAKNYLIPHFLKKAFNEKKETDKFFLILADSGMGKTTFMINLYVQYNSFFNFGRKYKIRLLPFGDNRIVQFLKEVKQEEAKNTILLLDAFDEYQGLQLTEQSENMTNDKRFRKRLDEIFELVRDFHEVVITSRTQYFPGQEDQPYELEIKRFDEKGYHTLAKLYLSPFDEHEIKKYLNKKYGRIKFWNFKRKKIARNIVKNSPKLMVRPMLLSYIDLLIDGKHSYKTSYEIYETLVEKWIEREARKEKHDAVERDKFKKDLHDFSRLAALKIYEQRKESETLSLKKETVEDICKTNKIDLQGYQITGKSLLTRDASHNWKFAHKSILEFLIAKEALNNNVFANKINYKGWDIVKEFYKEIVPENFLIVKGGTFNMGGRTTTLSDFFMSKYQVTQKVYENIVKKNPSHFKNNPDNPVEYVSWFDTITFCNLINKEWKLKPVYDEKGNLLDENGKVTRNINKVKGFRLPTEAEWEYAARGGQQSKGFKYAGSSILDEVGWYWENSGDKKLIGKWKLEKIEQNHCRTHPVGRLNQNELGLYDMSGNVWEWCYDGNAEYGKSDVENPVGPEKGSNRVIRGGGWSILAVYCASAYRDFTYAYDRSTNLGFRLVFVP